MNYLPDRSDDWPSHWFYRYTTLWQICAHSMWTSSSSTIITKLLTAFTGHSRTSLCSLNPIVASWTLFEFGSFHKFDKVLIIFVKAIVYSILSTSHSIMIKTLAFQTIMLSTNWTFIVIQSLIELKSCTTTCSWAPCCRRVILLYEFIERKFLEFLFQISISKLINVAYLKRYSTTLHRAFYVQLASFDFRLQVSSNAFRMEDMTALKQSEIVSIYFCEAYLTLPTFCFFLLGHFFIFYHLFLQKLFESHFILSILFLYLSLSKPFLSDKVRIYHTLFQILAYSLQHFLLFLINPLNFFVVLNTIDHYLSNCFFFQSFIQIKFLNHTELFFELKNKFLIKGSIN